MNTTLPGFYFKVLEDLKLRISRAQVKAVLAANAHLLAIYHDIGSAIAAQEAERGWGAKIVEQLSKDLKAAFPGMKGLSPRNLRYMRNFALAWPELRLLQSPDYLNLTAEAILQQPIAKLPWGHCCQLLDQLDSPEERLFYAEKAVENGWSRQVLAHQIESDLHRRQGKLQNNFKDILPGTQSELIQELFKDPYKFEFLRLGDEAQEKDIEIALTDHILKFLLEMGKHFAFVGRQVHLQVGQQDFYIDVLLYHTRIHAYVVLEIKLGEFKPEYAGKMGFYLSAIDESYRSEVDAPSIGIILCKSKDEVVVEYALRNINRPLGVSEYRLTKDIPNALQRDLPAIELLKEELVKDISMPRKATDEKLAQLRSSSSKSTHP